ncbi:MAG: molybdenum cofactor guanylyltransferase [Candidatus Aerophobus sp.]|nr:MAG: molybdenum cofactor guanylyltransferase [Candidatus Aerophobus sp.]
MVAIILSGGNNRRMLHNKAFLQMGQKSIIEREIEVLSTLFSRIIVVTNTPENHEHLRVSLVSDVVPGKGPLGGIYSGLMASKDKYNFVVSCDLPFLNAGLISYMIELTEGHDIVVPRLNGLVEPLHAIYSKHCLIPIKRQLDRNELKIQSFLDEVKVRYIRESEIKKYDPKGIAFFNVNTEEDLEKARLIAEN